MDFNFLFWLFLIGILIATFQDLKRREVDDWLNLFLIFSSFTYLFFVSFYLKDPSIFFQGTFLLLFLLFIMNVFYYGRVFAGGDAKLLLSMTVLFIGVSFYESLINVGIFVLFLFISGSVYGIFYSSVLYIRNYDKVNKKLKKNFWTKENKFIFILGLIFMFSGAYFHFILLITGILIFIFPILLSLSRALEEGCMVRFVKGSELKEGDWLVDEIRIGKKIVRPSFEGLSKKETSLMKNLKLVKIKEGIPFVPAFLIAYILYIFREAVFRFVLYKLS